MATPTHALTTCDLYFEGIGTVPACTLVQVVPYGDRWQATLPEEGWPAAQPHAITAAPLGPRVVLLHPMHLAF